MCTHPIHSSSNNSSCIYLTLCSNMKLFRDFRLHPFLYKTCHYIENFGEKALIFLGITKIVTQRRSKKNCAGTLRYTLTKSFRNHKNKNILWITKEIQYWYNFYIARTDPTYNHWTIKKSLVLPPLLVSGTIAFDFFQNVFNSYYVFQYILLMNPSMFESKAEHRFLMAQWKSNELKYVLPRQ